MADQTISIRINPGVREWAEGMEYASWEDEKYPQDDGTHVYPILQRRSTRVEIRNVEEARVVVESLEYWAEDTGIDSWTPARGKALERVVAQIREAFPGEIPLPPRYVPLDLRAALREASGE